MDVGAVIFDLDDTLIVEEGSAHASLRSAAALAPHLDPERVAEVVIACARRNWRGGPHHQLCLALGFASWEGLWSDFAGCHPCVDALREWAPKYRQRCWLESLAALDMESPELAARMPDAFVRAQRDAHPLVDGADSVVRDLVGHVRLGLLTNGPADIQRLKLVGTGLADCFDSVVISGEVGVGKPSVEIFRRVLAALEVPPSAAVMVGDSWERDVVGATNAGLSAVWVTSDTTLPGPVTTVHAITAIRELPDVL